VPLARADPDCAVNNDFLLILVAIFILQFTGLFQMGIWRLPGRKSKARRLFITIDIIGSTSLL
jgi:hypothetical protein